MLADEVFLEVSSSESAMIITSSSSLLSSLSADFLLLEVFGGWRFDAGFEDLVLDLEAELEVFLELAEAAGVGLLEGAGFLLPPVGPKKLRIS